MTEEIKEVQEIEDDPIEVRKAKRAAMIEAGENPYGHAFDYTHHASDIEAGYSQLEDGESTEDAVRFAGRIIAKRVQGKVSFMKPVSCHLYPIRVKKIGPYWGLNYDRWDVCQAAAIKGHREHIPVYKCLKEPLIRRFGQDWYDELELTVSEMKKQNII